MTTVQDNLKSYTLTLATLEADGYYTVLVVQCTIIIIIIIITDIS